MHFYKIYIKSKVSWLHLGNSLITLLDDYQKVFGFIKYLMKIHVVSLVQFLKNINWYYHMCRNSIKYYNPYFLIYFQNEYGFFSSWLCYLLTPDVILHWNIKIFEEYIQKYTKKDWVSKVFTCNTLLFRL